MSAELSGTQPILCAPVIREVDQQLIELLGSLDSAEWDLPTVVPQWQVREIAAHLLDTALRRLSMGRDKCRVEKVAVNSQEDVVALVNRLNREGVAVYRRLSAKVLIQLMQLSCAQTADFYESLDPFATAGIGVSWAGEMTSRVWFDNARELTERWHHQQQIRLATNRPGLMSRRLYHPVLDTFLRGLPHVFHRVSESDGTAVLIEVSGECGGKWCLSKTQDRWTFLDKLPSSVAAHVTIPQCIAWRIFTKGIDPSAARLQTNINGNIALGEHVLRLVAIVA